MTPNISVMCRMLFAAAMFTLATTPVVAATEATSAATKARMIQLINRMESDPFMKDGKDVRREVLVWLMEAPDVSVRVCLNIIGEREKTNGDEGGILSVQLAFSEAKFLLEDPDKAKDQSAVSVAGVEGVLRTYAAMRAVNPELRLREFDELARWQASGRLVAEVETRLATCE